MKNIKKCILYMMTVLLVIPHYSMAGLWRPAGEACVHAIDDTLTKQLPVFAKMIQDLTSSGCEMTKVLTDGTVEVTKVAGEAVVEASANIGVEAVEKLADVGNLGVTVLGVAVAAYSIVQLYPIGKEIVSTICPSDAQKAQQEAELKSAQKKLQILDAEEAFRECLIKNRNNPNKGASGFPRTCEAAAEVYAFLGNYSEVEQARAYFNRCMS